jgi:hypothetical protein
VSDTPEQIARRAEVRALQAQIREAIARRHAREMADARAEAERLDAAGVPQLALARERAAARDGMTDEEREAFDAAQAKANGARMDKETNDAWDAAQADRAEQS